MGDSEETKDMIDHLEEKRAEIFKQLHNNHEKKMQKKKSTLNLMRRKSKMSFKNAHDSQSESVSEDLSLYDGDEERVKYLMLQKDSFGFESWNY